MSVTNLHYYKRYRMEVDLRRTLLPAPSIPMGYALARWSDELLYEHARVKHASFREELDSVLFPCFNDLDACWRLMQEIRSKKGFVPEATWLVRMRPPGAAESRSGRLPERLCDAPLETLSREASLAGPPPFEACGTIQAIRTHRHRANIQNIGVTPRHRGLGLGRLLILACLEGLRQVGVTRASLEVTAENLPAVHLYRRLGFRPTRTLYKAVEQPVDSLL